MTATLNLADLESEMVHDDPIVWLETWGRIYDDRDTLIIPKANTLQRKIGAVYAYCRENNLPFRLISLKPRQRGQSTIVTGLLYHHCSTAKAQAMIIGGNDFQSSNLLKMVATYSQTDGFFNAGLDNMGNRVNPSNVLAEEGRWANGSTVRKITAGNKNAGKSATVQFMVATELAMWALKGEYDAAKVLSGALNCVAEKPDTYVILESTANGAQGEFYDRYRAASTFEEFKRTHDGYVRIFTAWFEFEDAIVTQSPEKERLMMQQITPQEREYVADLADTLGITLTPPQIAWMRQKLNGPCKGDWDVFNQDYPKDDVSAFLSSGRPKFDQRALNALALAAPNYAYEHGNLTAMPSHDGLVSLHALFHPSHSTDTASSTVTIWEKPRPGCRYLLTFDPCTGASQQSGGDPDHHGILVIRRGYDYNGVWQPTCVAARLGVQVGKKWECRWDKDVAALTTVLLARLYGNCMVVIESNMEGGIIDLLRSEYCVLYIRREFNKLEQKFTEYFGFHTTTATRKLVVDTLAVAVRKSAPREGESSTPESLDLRCPWLISELQNAITLRSGRVEAAPGHHDDQWMALGMGLCCLDSATIYRPPPGRSRAFGTHPQGGGSTGRPGAWS